MKISNYKIVRLSMYLILGLIFFCIIFSTIVFLLHIIKKEILIAVTGFIIVALILIFINLRTFTFEYSGEVISIKIFHPLENELYSRSIEFPSRKLKNFAIVKKFPGYEMVLIIKSFRKKEIMEKVFLKWLNPQQLNNLIQSLEKIKSDNDNNAEQV